MPSIQSRGKEYSGTQTAAIDLYPAQGQRPTTLMRVGANESK
jgi:hypothetical protein